MKILKFGGKSLANGEGLQKVIQTIAQKYFNNEPIAVVVSARGNATDELLILLKKAQVKIEFKSDFEQFKKYQLEGLKENIFEEEFSTLHKLFEGVSLLGDYSEKIKHGGSHPTAKPSKLWEYCIDRFHGNLIYEPFSGSGTTIIAAENLSRQCRAVEISPGYVAVALQRYLDAFGIRGELAG